TRFYYKTGDKVLEMADENVRSTGYDNALVALIHAEKEDEDDSQGVEKKLVKNLKWAAKKNNTNVVILHSFAHLSDSKAAPEFTKKLFNSTEKRMKNAEYETFQTPFGYFLDLDLKAPGYSMARVFKNF
ncbi:MAG: hypothetical protein IMY70_03775, partial [Bacteroidetes bacterium]|nr:hypothetical protein [Bacteroidota bacterium]